MIIPAIRAGGTADLEAIGAIQAASPDAAQWDMRSYLGYDVRVAVCEEQIAGFVISRSAAGQECEILNLAVSPGFRRRGIGRALVGSLLAGFTGPIFLEVRPSNEAAIALYKSLGFQEISRRPGYYQSPPEPAIVMKFHSC